MILCYEQGLLFRQLIPIEIAAKFNICICWGKLAYNLFFHVAEGEWVRREEKKRRGLWGNFSLESHSIFPGHLE